MRFCWAIKLPEAVPPPCRYCQIKQQSLHREGWRSFGLDCVKDLKSKTFSIRDENSNVPYTDLREVKQLPEKLLSYWMSYCILCSVLQSLSPPSEASSPVLVLLSSSEQIWGLWFWCQWVTQRRSSPRKGCWNLAPYRKSIALKKVAGKIPTISLFPVKV